jgi:uncharacterized protein (DUF58 family)
MDIFDVSTLHALEQLMLVANRVRAGVMKGDRRSRKRGTSIEFADYRDYSKGDDLRRLDWNIYARLERPFIKLLEEEEDLALHLLVDASASMDWPSNGNQDGNKFRYGLRLAGALGHIGLSNQDRTIVSLLAAGDERRWGPHRGRQHSMRLLEFLDSASSGGETNLNRALRQYAGRATRPGLLFLISDMLSPEGFEQGVDELGSRGHELSIIHLLSADEMDPPHGGDLKLVDVETGADEEISLDVSTVGLYKRRLEAWLGEISRFCARRDIHYVPVNTAIPWQKLVLHTLREQQILK